MCRNYFIVMRILLVGGGGGGGGSYRSNHSTWRCSVALGNELPVVCFITWRWFYTIGSNSSHPLNVLLLWIMSAHSCLLFLNVEPLHGWNGLFTSSCRHLSVYTLTRGSILILPHSRSLPKALMGTYQDSIIMRQKEITLKCQCFS